MLLSYNNHHFHRINIFLIYLHDLISLEFIFIQNLRIYLLDSFLFFSMHDLNQGYDALL